MMMKRVTGILVTVVSIMAFLPSAHAAEAKSVIDGKRQNGQKSALEILKRSYEYTQSLKKFSFSATTLNDDVYKDEMVFELHHDIKLKLSRPNGIRIDIDGDAKHRRYYLYKGKFTMEDKTLGYYGEIEIPEKIDDALDALYDRFGIRTPLANLLYSNLTDRIMPDHEGIYFGTVLLSGKKCDYLGFYDENREFQVWIEQGKRPLVKKFKIIDKTSPWRLSSSTTIDWKIPRKIGKSNFIFKKRKGLMEIPILDWEENLSSTDNDGGEK